MQCCVERSQSFTNVSFEELRRSQEVVLVDVDAVAVGYLERKRIFVIWSRWPLSLCPCLALAVDALEDHAPEKASFPNYVP